MSAIVAIPARLDSSRLPRKVLLDINGRPMLWHVYHGIAQAKSIKEIWVLTDSEEVYQEATSWGAKALMTSRDCPSGTARIASVANQLNGEIIVNVQADEPLITGDIVDLIVNGLERSNADVATPIFRITEASDIQNPNLVKVVRDNVGHALYFSRSAIPHVRDLNPSEWLNAADFWGHIGLYAYRRKSILEYMELPNARLEAAEKLEQLRLLESGRTIMTIEVSHQLQGVDTLADLEVVRRLIKP